MVATAKRATTRKNPTSSGGPTPEGGTTRRNPAKPVTARDKAMSKRHLRESIRYNEAHARDHMKAAQADKKLLKKRGK